jgi:hypothetical protein
MAKALYYPYIHIRDVNWLKGTLLLFPQVRRMIPYGNFTPDDSPEIRAFATSIGREPLLKPANLRHPRVVNAQLALATKLQDDAKDRGFRRRYDRKAAAPEIVKDPLGFQIHARKLEPTLVDALRACNITQTGCRRLALCSESRRADRDMLVGLPLRTTPTSSVISWVS